MKKTKQKQTNNDVYSLIATATFMILVIDTLFRVHPLGNIIAVVLLLIACFRIGRAGSE
jgi:hypothetical protein